MELLIKAKLNILIAGGSGGIFNFDYITPTALPPAMGIFNLALMRSSIQIPSRVKFRAGELLEIRTFDLGFGNGCLSLGVGVPSNNFLR
jgi:hypothetical protein